MKKIGDVYNYQLVGKEKFDASDIKILNDIAGASDSGKIKIEADSFNILSNRFYINTKEFGKIHKLDKYDVFMIENKIHWFLKKLEEIIKLPVIIGYQLREKKDNFFTNYYTPVVGKSDFKIIISCLETRKDLKIRISIHPNRYGNECKNRGDLILTVDKSTGHLKDYHFRSYLKDHITGDAITDKVDNSGDLENLNHFTYLLEDEFLQLKEITRSINDFMELIEAGELSYQERKEFSDQGNFLD